MKRYFSCCAPPHSQRSLSKANVHTRNEQSNYLRRMHLHRFLCSLCRELMIISHVAHLANEWGCEVFHDSSAAVLQLTVAAISFSTTPLATPR